MVGGGSVICGKVGSVAIVPGGADVLTLAVDDDSTAADVFDPLPPHAPTAVPTHKTQMTIRGQLKNNCVPRVSE